MNLISLGGFSISIKIIAVRKLVKKFNLVMAVS
jgi:hypothetical protein